MKNLTLFTLFLIGLGLTTHAQRRRPADDTSHYRSEPVPAHLMPIERAVGSSSFGSTYFYGGKRLSSPYSLEIPFYELNDPTVTYHFRTFRTMNTLGQFTGLVPLAYLLIQRGRVNGTTYWTLFGGSIAGTLAFNIIGGSQVSKAVSRYNQMLRQPRVGLSAVPTPLTGQPAVGVGVTWSLK